MMDWGAIALAAVGLVIGYVAIAGLRWRAFRQRMLIELLISKGLITRSEWLAAIEAKRVWKWRGRH